MNIKENQADEKWVLLPKRLTFGMRTALEEALIRHERDLDKIYSEILDCAPRSAITQFGWTISKQRGGTGIQGWYRLESVDNGGRA